MPRGVSAQGRVSALEGVCPGGCVCLGEVYTTTPPWTEFLTIANKLLRAECIPLFSKGPDVLQFRKPSSHHASETMEFVIETRMHSIRMRTVRCSGRLGGGAQGCVCPGECVCLGGCLPRGVCLPRGSVHHHTPMDRILDTCL